MSRVALAALLCLAPGCLFPLAGLSTRSTVKTEAGDVQIIASPAEPVEQQRVERAVNAATKHLLRWGKLEVPVTLYLLPSHLRLTSAINGFGFDWLRAWAQYDVVYLQSPATWGWLVTDGEVDELLLHELTHCVMYQRIGDATSWNTKEVPVWFREGMATWTANQAYKFPSLEDLARFYDKNPDLDPMLNPAPMYRDDSAIVYAAAHHGFTFFVRRMGQQSVHRLLDAMHGGQRFPAAFLAVTGISAEAFAREFRRYIQWRGFRGIGKPKSGLGR